MTVKVVDVQPLIDKVTAIVRERRPKMLPEGSTLTVPHRWALASRGDLIYMLCDEGVGYLVPEKPDPEDRWFGFYRRGSVQTPDGVKQTFSIMPDWEASLDLEEVMGLPIVEHMDLADFVRVFGARLEDNFALWRATLAEGAMT